MERGRSPPNVNYGYENEPNERRITSRQYNYWEEPPEDRITSRQYNYRKEPPEERITSRQYKYREEPPEERITSRQYKYREETPEQRFTSRQYQYREEPPEQRFTSRQYQYREDPPEECITSRQYQYREKPPEERFTSRQYKYREEPPEQRFTSRQYKYREEPPEERITSRQYKYREEPPEDRIISRQNFGYEEIGPLTSNQPTPMQYQGPGQYEGPQVHYVPGQQVNIVPTYGQAFPQPGAQYMVRDTATPMPTDSDDPAMITCVYIGRAISGLFIILDICLSWIQVAAMNGSTEVPSWLNFLEVDNNLIGWSTVSTKSIQGLKRLTSTYTAFCVIGTVYGLFQIVNMVGETIVEYNKQRSSENEPGFRGFQIIHGWVETVIGMVCDDIPQAVLLLCFSLWYRFKIIVAAKMFAWYLIKMFKTNGRVESCKHHYKYNCKCECKQNKFEKCCEYSVNFCCKIFYFRPCASGEKPRCETKSFDIWPDINCLRGGRCCGEIDQDPEWARNLYFKLDKLHFVLFLVITSLPVVKHFTRVLDLPLVP